MFLSASTEKKKCYQTQIWVSTWHYKSIKSCVKNNGYTTIREPDPAQLSSTFCIASLGKLGRCLRTSLASSPGSAQEKCLVTHAKILVCTVSTVAVWSKQIMLILYQLLILDYMNLVASSQDCLKMGTRLADFSYASKFRNLEHIHV